VVPKGAISVPNLLSGEPTAGFCCPDRLPRPVVGWPDRCSPTTQHPGGEMMSSLHSTGTSTISTTCQRWLSSATRAFDGGQVAHSGAGWRAAGVAGRAGCWGRAAVRADRHR
jgi:hypothetical protein